ncbi:MAG: ABC transporter permease [Clostridia bacterium]|nr:ABC transporter permease [Clostridia bacterium]
MDILTVFKEIWTRRLRHSLTVLAIAVSVSAVVVIGAIGQTGKTLVTRELDSLGLDGITVGASADSSGGLSAEQLNSIKSLSFVERATPIVTQYTKSVLRGSKTDCLVWGIDSGCDSLISLDLLYGRNISRKDVSSNARVCLIDKTMAEDRYGRENIVGKTIGVLLGGKYADMEIIGIVKADSSLLQSVSAYIPSFVYMPYSSLMSMSDSKSYNQIAVQLESSCDADAASRAIVGSLSSGGGEYYSENLAKQRDKLTNMLDMITMVMSAIGFVSLLVAGLGIMTCMIVSVRERTREIGIKKAIGARKTAIMAEFLAESAFISLVGCIFGITLGELLCLAGSGLLGISVYAPFESLVLCAAVSVAAGLVFGVYPAAKAAGMKPVDALKGD